MNNCALKSRLAPEMLAVYETGVRYQLVHALALLAVAWAVTRWPGTWVHASGWLFVAGTLLFSGSLYALALSGVRGLGAVTPFCACSSVPVFIGLVAAGTAPAAVAERHELHVGLGSPVAVRAEPGGVSHGHGVE